MQPAAAQRGGGGLFVGPVACHHRFAAHHHLARFPGGHGPVLGIHHAHFHAGMRHAHRGDALGPARVGGVGQMRACQGGDGHGALALAVDLHELLAQGVQRAAQVLHVHGAAAVDDGLEAVRGGARAPHVLHQAMHHGRRGEERQPPHAGGEPHQLGWVETAGFGHHVARAAQHVGVVVQARAVRHGGGVDHGVLRVDVVHVGEIGHGHGQQVAVGLHHALGPARGAGGVEERGHVLRRAGVHLQRRALRGLLPGVAAQPLQRGGRGAGGQRRIAQRAGHAHGARAAVLQHVGQLARMQLVVDGHRHRAGPVDGMQRLQVLRAVGREDGHAVARRHAAARAQVAGQGRHAGGKPAVVVQHALAGQQRRSAGKNLGAAPQQVGNVHRCRRLLPCTISRRWHGHPLS
jgi:hypothetical protein